jgi:hypothetical protein
MQTDWASRYSGAGSLEDAGQAIVVDDSENVYITGYSETASGFSCVTIKYNKLGDNLWIRIYARPGKNYNIGNDIKLDDSNNVYVVCESILKYDKNGNLLWAKYDSAYYEKIILDSLGNIYAGGVSSRKYVTGKYDKNGNRIWKKTYTFAGSDNNDIFRDLILDNSGNAIVTGSSRSMTMFYDYLTLKYSSNGNLIWARRYNGPSSYSDDGAYGVTSDLRNNIYVTGYSMDTLNNDNSLTIKYDSAGNVIWTKRISGIANIGYDLAVDSSQNVFIAGRQGGRTSTIKLNISGDILWSRTFPYGSVLTTNYPVIILDSINNVYVTANSTITGASDYAAIKYDSSGNQIFVVTYNNLNIGFDYANDMAVDKVGSVYLTGKSQGSGSYYDYATVKFSPIPTNIITNYSQPTEYKLEQNYPNPFNPSTVINYYIPSDVKRQTSDVKLIIYNTPGMEIATLVNEKQLTGSYSVTFDGSDLPSGMYFYKLFINGNSIETKRMVLLK